MYGKGTLSDEKAPFPCSFLSAACYLKRDKSLTCGIGETLTCTTGETLTSFEGVFAPPFRRGLGRSLFLEGEKAF